MLGRKVRPNWIPSVIYKEIENQRMKENLVNTYKYIVSIGVIEFWQMEHQLFINFCIKYSISM
jgi:hypothetical protein